MVLRDANCCDETDAMNKSVRTPFGTEATVKGIQKLSLHASVEQQDVIDRSSYSQYWSKAPIRRFRCGTRIELI